MPEFKGKLGTAWVEIKGDMGSLQKDLKQAKMHTERAAVAMSETIMKHSAGIRAIGAAIAAIGGAVSGALGLAIKTTGEFEQAMANVQSVAGASADELQALSGYARKMGRQTVFSARQSADAMYYLASAGMEVNEIMGSLEATLSLSAATQSELASTTATVAGTLSAYGLAAEEAARVSNVFSAAIAGSQATMDKISTSMQYVGPVAKSMNMSLEETVAVLGSLYNANIDASSAGTSFRSAISRLIKPSKEAQEVLQRLGIEVRDAAGAILPFTNVIRQLEKQGLSTADALTLFGERAGPNMLALVSRGADSLDELQRQITGTNKAAEMAATQVSTFQGQMKILRSAVEELQISIGIRLIPIATQLVKTLKDVVDNVNEWTERHPDLTNALVKFAAVAGPMVAAGGILMLLAPTLISAANAAVQLSIALKGLQAATIASQLASVGGTLALIDSILKRAKKRRSEIKKDKRLS